MNETPTYNKAERMFGLHPEVASAYERGRALFGSALMYTDDSSHRLAFLCQSELGEYAIVPAYSWASKGSRNAAWGILCSYGQAS